MVVVVVLGNYERYDGRWLSPACESWPSALSSFLAEQSRAASKQGSFQRLHLYQHSLTPGLRFCKNRYKDFEHTYIALLADKKASTMLLNLLCRVMKLSFQDGLENWLFGKIQILFLRPNRIPKKH